MSLWSLSLNGNSGYYHKDALFAYSFVDLGSWDNIDNDAYNYLCVVGGTKEDV